MKDLELVPRTRCAHNIQSRMYEKKMAATSTHDAEKSEMKTVSMMRDRNGHIVKQTIRKEKRGIGWTRVEDRSRCFLVGVGNIDSSRS